MLTPSTLSDLHSIATSNILLKLSTLSLNANISGSRGGAGTAGNTPSSG